MFFRVFLSGNGKQQALQQENVRGTRGSLKKRSESLNKCEKSAKKAKYAVFIGVTRQLGNAF